MFQPVRSSLHRLLATGTSRPTVPVYLCSMTLENQNETLTRLAETISDLNTSTSQNSRQADVAAVSVNLPEFWPEDPEVWFIRVEAQLRSWSFTQNQTKFDNVVASLDNSTAAEVKAVLLHPQQPICMMLSKRHCWALSKKHKPKRTQNFSIFRV